MKLQIYAWSLYLISKQAAKQMLVNYVKFNLYISRWDPPLSGFSECTSKQIVHLWLRDFTVMFTAFGGACDNRSTRWLIIPTVALTALQRLAFDPRRWGITSAAERMIGGKRDGPNLLSRYYTPVKQDSRGRAGETRGTRGGRGRAKQKQRERWINQETARMQESEATEEW